MALPLAIPLAAPIAPGAVAAAATFAVGTVAHVAQQVYGFRAPLPPLPRATGRVGEETLQELIADAIAGARVPVALPPSPFGPRGNLAALGLQALAWWWGQLNSRPESAKVIPPHTGTSISGTVPPPGNTVGASLTITESAYTHSYYGLSDCKTIVDVSGPGDSYTLTNVKKITFEKRGSGCFGLPTQLYWIVEHTDFRETDERNITTGGYGHIAWNRSYSLSWDHPTAVPYEPEISQLPLPDGFVWPRVEPQPSEPATLPTPLPLPLPSTVPQVEPSTEPDALPAPSPLVPITPGPVAPPIVRPATPYSPQPTKLPAPTATSNGTLVAPAPVPVPTTPQDAIYPVPGGLPVTGQTIPPTLQAVAQEVGRIEQKIDRMLNPVEGQWGDATDRLQLLWTLLRDLFNALTDGAPAGAYQLSSPCVVDGNGDRIIYETEWPEQGTNHGAILARVDAIAALLQVHKDLKQPNCHIPPVAVGGEFVTVNFEQID